MLSWLFVILLSYFFFSVSVFGDKIMLSGKPNPKSYTFYVSILNAVVLVLLPFASFGSLNIISIAWVLLAGLCTVIAQYLLFSAIEEFDVSRVMPAVGALQPIFVFVLTQIFFGFQSMGLAGWLAFLALMAGSFIISTETAFTVKPRYLALVSASALMFSLSYIFSKIVFLSQPFFSGMVLMGLCNVFFGLILLLDTNFRRQVFSKKAAFGKKNGLTFLSFQISGASAAFLQNLAIALVPVGYLAVMNSLRGVQYVFLFAITLFFSLLLPRIFKEKVSAGIIIKKAVSILLIIIGLILLVI